MATCSITSGYAIDCRDSVGGVETIYLIENSALYDASGISRVIDSSGTITAITKNTGKRFYEFQVPRGTASTSNTITSSQENGTIYYTHMVTFPINQRNATIRNIVATLAKNRCTFIVKEGDGTYKMFGRGFGLTLDTAEAGSGVALGDRNGYSLSFSSMESEDFLVCPSNLVASLIVPGA
jgi:hypothetical protein